MRIIFLNKLILRLFISLLSVFTLFMLTACQHQKPQQLIINMPGQPRDEIQPTGSEIVVETEGHSYMGDKDKLEEVRRRAREEAMHRAAEEGARIYIESYSRSELGVLQQDTVERVLAGILTRVKTLYDDWDRDNRNRYTVRIQATVAPADLSRALAHQRNQPSWKPNLQKPLKRPSWIKPRPSKFRPSDLRYLRACFYEFTEVYLRRIYTVLKDAPGVNKVKRIGTDADHCLCYQLTYKGSMERLKNWLHRELRTSVVTTFRMEAMGDDMLEVYFDGGFD
ncbi:hypothetical protein GMMP15_2100011 [Candidatus Magnetomoraceae bacterium gMMP-15]